jgi:hypothetical protein
MLLRRRMATLFVLLGVRLRGGRAEFGAERALSARRSSRHQRHALTGLPDSEPQLGARGRPSHWC